MTVDRHVGDLVIGAGPAGIAAASRLAEAGREVLLVDEGARPGGQIWRQRPGVHPPVTARVWLDRLERSQAQCWHDCGVIDALPDGGFLAEQGGRRLMIHARNVILATGARERFLPFPGWTLPGVVGVGAVQALVKAGLRVNGLKVVLAGSGPLLLPVASLLRQEGAAVRLIAEQASAASMRRFILGLWRAPGKVWEAVGYRLRTLGTAYRFGVWTTAAQGESRIGRVELSDGQRTWTEECDLLCCAYGLVPNVELARCLGCEMEGERVRVDRYQRTNRGWVYCVGEATGIGGADLAIAEGEVAAAHLAGQATRLPSLLRRRDRLRRFAEGLASTFSPRRELRERVQADTVICRCEDVRRERIEPDWSVRQAKLYTRLGMGPCQGRICGPAASFLWDWEPDRVRPPLKPCRLSSLSGSLAEHPEER